MSSFLTAIQTPKSVARYIHGVNVSERFGESNKDIIGTDETIRYMYNLAQEKHEETGKTYMVTKPFSTLANVRENDPHSIQSVAKELSKLYLESLRHGIDGGVYTALAASSNLGAESHQNWLYFSGTEQLLLRFEPSQDYNELFKTTDLCNEIVNNLRSKGVEVQYRIAEHGLGLNTFSACRAFSTLLAAMNLAEVSPSKAKNLSGSDLKKRKFVSGMQGEMTECGKPTPSFRETRKGRIDYVITGKK